MPKGFCSLKGSTENLFPAPMKQIDPGSPKQFLSSVTEKLVQKIVFYEDKMVFFQITPLKEKVTAWHFRLHEKSDDTLTAAKLHPFLPSLGKTPGIYVH